MELTSEHYGENVDLAQLPEDRNVYHALQRADTIGMFQVESRAQWLHFLETIQKNVTIWWCRLLSSDLVRLLGG
jgi:hypothetical protein